MAKKTETVPATPARVVPGLAAAIREGFEVLPEAKSSGNRDALKALKEWIKTTYPELADKVELPVFSSTLAGQRNKSAETVTIPGGIKKIGVVGEPTLTDLMAAKELANKLKMKPDEFSLLLTEIIKFGDTEKLWKCMNALYELGNG